MDVLRGCDVLLKRDGTLDGAACHLLLLGTMIAAALALCTLREITLDISTSGFGRKP